MHGAPVEAPETVATAIRIGNPASWAGAAAARDESGGLIEAVSDEEILDAQRDIVRLEGVFCEPASAAGVAGVRRLAADRAHRSSEETVVCVLTGHGLKDPDAVAGRGGIAHPDPRRARRDPGGDGALTSTLGGVGAAAGVEDGGEKLLRRAVLAHVGRPHAVEEAVPLGVGPAGEDDLELRPSARRSR